MQRRRFLKGSIAGSVIVLGGAGLWYVTNEQTTLDIRAAVARLDGLKGTTLKASGSWSAAQIFNHAAQSVEYSMTGYPEHKSDVFKASVGSLAFSLFASHGSMHHPLDEVIPGAPLLDANADPQQALDRLKGALLRFERFDGALFEHFAYGPLSKSDYALAHVLHLNNHLEEIAAV